MNNDTASILSAVRDGSMSVEDALVRLRTAPFEDLGFAKIDHHRAVRTGVPEVVYCAGKTPAQTRSIMEALLKGSEHNILGTRATQAHWEAVCSLDDRFVYNEMARTITLHREDLTEPNGFILVMTGGTSDLPVAEEAVVTAQMLGNRVVSLHDVGVAGLHRMLSHVDTIMSANVVVAVAGMEGALPSVVAGLVDKPVIAVPTSVGYGANFGGLSALLAMLNSCGSGVSVVNIDNGFGAGFLASRINHMNL